MTKEELITQLTSKDDNSACAFAEMIISESAESDKWYEYFYVFAELLNHKKSYVRNRAMLTLAAVAKWDREDHFEKLLPSFFPHITDEKPITSRQCIKALARIGKVKPQYIPMILSAFEKADLSKYKDSMIPLIKKDIEEAEKLLKDV